MSQQVAIKVEGLGKKYHIGEKTRKLNTLRDALAYGAKNFARNFDFRQNNSRKTATSEFWALKDINFEVKQGEVVGIIGRNGAGKSTLLKILSRITEPTEGFVDIYGRVGSLLEVGTGFHPELTGRENIFLNGSILGMKRHEIARQFEQIVEFAEVEKFIETPVKHYSSGMYLRLAFAVAAHLQPEILLVDEVLAVGDQMFQKKCLGKMDDVAKQGRTVLFVSHNMSAVQDLCRRGILIEGGQIAFDGKIGQCVGEYYKKNEVVNQNENDTSNNGNPLQLSALKIDDRFNANVETGQSFTVSLNVRGQKVRNPMIFFILENVAGQQIIHHRVNSKDIGLEEINGNHVLHLSVPGLWLSPGVYAIYFKFLTSSVEWSGKSFSERILLEVNGDLENTGKAILHPKIEWSFSKKVSAAAVHG